MGNHTFLLLHIITAAILSIITMFPIQSDHHLFTVSAALLNVTFIISTWVIASHSMLNCASCQYSLLT